MPSQDPPPPPNLTRTVIRAGRAVSLMMGIEYLIVLARTLILSRLLDPHEFGLMGMAFIAISTVEVLSQTGFSRAIIQMPGDPRPFLPTVWSVAAARGVVTMALVMLVSPFVGHFFKAPDAIPVLQAVAILLLLRGLMSPAWYLLERDLRPARFHLPRTVGVGLDLVVTTALALQWRSVWAMVGGMLTGALLELALTYVVAPFRPAPVLDRAQARQLYGFGKHVFRYDLVSCLVEQADRICVGRMRSAVDMGLYSFASRLATIPGQFLYTAIARVAFPSFSRIQSEQQRVREALARLLGLISLTSFPVAAGLALTAPMFVPVLFGTKWLPMVGAFQLLCLAGAVNLLQSALASVTSSIGRPHLSVQASVVRLTVVLSVIPATAVYGIQGASAAVLAASLASCAFLLTRLVRLLDADPARFVPLFLIPGAASAAMAITVTGVRAWLDPLPAGIVLPAACAAGGAVYAAMALALDKHRGTGMTASLMSVLRPGAGQAGAIRSR